MFVQVGHENIEGNLMTVARQGGRIIWSVQSKPHYSPCNRLYEFFSLCINRSIKIMLENTFEIN